MNTPLNDPQQIRQQYADSSNLAARIRLHRDYSVQAQDMWLWFFDIVLKRVPQAMQVDVLEVGSGRGDVWRKNAGRIPETWVITLTDQSAAFWKTTAIIWARR